MLDWNTLYKTGKDFGTLPEHVIDFIIKNTLPAAPKTFLDIGCGTGWLTRELQQRGYEGTGIDTAREAITIAKSRTELVRYHVCNIETDDLSTLSAASFGLITCKHVYAFIDNKLHFLERVAHLLAADGTFVLVTPLLESSPDKPGIAVDGNVLRKDLDKFFTVIVDKSLVSGQLFIMRYKHSS